MKFISLFFILFVAACATKDAPAEPAQTERNTNMQLGAFSVSLAVKDIKKSKAFYEKLGFAQVHGDLAQNWIILQNDDTTIGLFQGMFENNILTFNPGWTPQQETVKGFTDVRDLQADFLAKGIEVQTKADAEGTGPASFVLVDPDGNAILFDQHVDRPE